MTNYLDALIAAEREVGLQYVVVTETDVVLDYAAGSLDAKTSRLVTPESTFLTASTTKVLTAAAVLRLVEQGRLALDDSLSKHVPQHPYGREVCSSTRIVSRRQLQGTAAFVPPRNES